MDERTLAQGYPVIDCSPPPSCDALPVPDKPVHPAAPVLLSACAESECSDDADAGPSDAGACLAERVHELPLMAQCQAIELRADRDASDVMLSQPRWSQVNLLLSAQTAWHIVLSGPELQGVFIELRGPVVLSIEDTEQLSDLRVTGAANANGTPRLELSRVSVDGVSIGARSEDSGFAGTLALKAVQMQDVDLHADTVNLESVLARHASLSADTLFATDATLDQTHVAAGRAVLAAFSTQQTDLRFCEDAVLVDGDMNRSALSGCPDASLRVYSCLVSSGSLDGNLVLDTTSVEHTRLAPSAMQTTHLVSFDSQFMSDGLCRNLELFALGMGSTIKCSACDGVFVGSKRACSAPDALVPQPGNYCDAISDTEPLPVCSEELPKRTRPRAR